MQANQLLRSFIPYFIGALLITTSVQAEQTAWLEGKHLFDAGEVEKAFLVLEPLEPEWGGVLAYDLLLGRVLMRMHKWERASFAMERVLIADPNHGEALAATQTIQKKMAESALRGENAIAQTRLKGFVRLGMGYDGNVSQGPDAHSMLFPTIDHLGSFDLDSLSRESDPFTLMGMVVGLSHDLPGPWQIIGSAELDIKRQLDRDDLREATGTLRVGVLHNLKRDQVGFVGLANLWRLGGENYRSSYGGIASYRYRPKPQRSITLSYQVLRHDHPNDPDLNGVDQQLTVQHHHQQPGIRPSSTSITARLRRKRVVGVDLDVTTTNAYLAYDGAGVTLERTHPLDDTLTVQGSLGYEYRWHHEMMPLYYDDQRDSQINFSLALGWRAKPDWELFLAGQYTKNTSNQDVFDYDRMVLSILSRWYFDHEMP
ncbi:tetratricopeptide repeat protein [Magnetococcus sp. PR-3]|uniref:tetratricopeptide repeat protein n=1 Tax=Magnetococcus sp. PR-3 TaxID=3120355 RepID=UPI002FCE1788